MTLNITPAPRKLGLGDTLHNRSKKKRNNIPDLWYQGSRSKAEDFDITGGGRPWLTRSDR